MSPGQDSRAGLSPLYFREQGDRLHCTLCPHKCRIPPGRTGRCGVRGNRSGVPDLPALGYITAWAADPVEKKPLYHFHPGETVWSAGFNGCNLHCPFCQNYRISLSGTVLGEYVPPADLVQSVLDAGGRIIAYTYSEPTVHIEYLLECARLARERGLLNVLVTNGNLNDAPARRLLERMDGVNADLKSWNADYYRRTLGGDLETVKNFITLARELSWVEVTTLVVPGDNDSEAEMESISGWLSSLGPEVPFHLSAYHPSHGYSRPPTAPERMHRLAARARENLDFVYIGNIGAENDTLCPGCGALLIERRYYRTRSRIESGTCPECSRPVPGRFPGRDGGAGQLT